MKYLKLFENWLNEAEGETKPFDPKNPSETLIFDISNEDIFKNSESIDMILKSIFSKAFDKQELKDSESVSVITLYPYEFAADNKFLELHSKPSGQGDKYIMKSSDITKFGQKLTQLGVSVNDFKDNKIIYLVTLGNNQNWKDSDNNIKLDQKTFFVFADTQPQDQKQSLESEWIVVTDLNNPMKVSLGQLAAFSSTKFENLAMLKDKEAGSPVMIAKLFGYEIPKNYTPKSGTAKKLEK